MSDKKDVLEAAVNLQKKATELLNSEDGKKVISKLNEVASSEKGEELKNSAAGKAILGDDGKFDAEDIARLGKEAKKLTDLLGGTEKK